MQSPLTVPPVQYQKIMGHHWLKFPPTGEMMILQWNPSSKTWCHSNAHDKPIELRGWEYVGYIPYPDSLFRDFS